MPEVTKHGVLDMQVCVPIGWSDEKVEAFANTGVPHGTSGGWHIRKQGDPLLRGDPERNPCEARRGMCHVMLDL